MDWFDPPPASTLGIDWRRLADHAIDPYLVWADLSDFSGTPRPADTGAPRTLSVALELQADAGDIGVPYRPVVAYGQRLWATATVFPHQLAGLLVHPAVLRLELGFAGAVRPAPLRTASPPRVARPVIAVIDSGCAFAHERFRHWRDGAWHTRIAYLWDQSANAPDGTYRPWQAVAGPGYGRELTSAAIDALLSAHSGPGAVDEDAVYREARYRSVATMRTHGTHVLDLAAGADFDAAAEDQPEIIFVQLPEFAVDDTSGGSMVTHVMDALRYIVARTAEGQGLVVNLSYGSMAGPHDGSTLLESAMDALIDAQTQPAGGGPGRHFAIVLPAGNNYESDCHACLTLDAHQPAQTLQWQLPSGDASDTFLELWYDQAWAGEVRVSLRPPGGTRRTVAIDELAVMRTAAGGATVGALIHRRQVASGRNDAMALIALAPTRNADQPDREVGAGIWDVTVELVAPAGFKGSIEVHAWIERDDPVIGAGAAPRQSRLLSSHPPLPRNAGSPASDRVRREGTGNSIAQGRRTVVVGGCMQGSGALELARYSSSGPSRNVQRACWPDLIAAVDDSPSRGGLRAAGTRSGVTVRMNGTSVAAPQVARRLIDAFLPAPLVPPVKVRLRRDQGKVPAPAGLSIEAPPDGADPLRTGRGRLEP